MCESRLRYAVKALVYDGEMKSASKLGKLHRKNLTAAAAVALATGWAMAGKGRTSLSGACPGTCTHAAAGKKASKVAAFAREKLAPGSDAQLNPFKKADSGSSHEMYSVHQASELQVVQPFNSRAHNR